MPRYHFHAQQADGMIADLEGETLPDIDAARKEATASAREALINFLRFGDDPPIAIQVVDGDGNEVLTVALMDLIPKSIRR